MIQTKETALFKKDAIASKLNSIESGLSGKADSTAAILKSQTIFYRSASATRPSAPSGNNSWVTRDDDVTGAWTRRHLKISPNKNNAAQNYVYIWTCTQDMPVQGNPFCSGVALDESITVIQGGSIVTGSITANQLAAGAVTADKIKTGEITIGIVSGLQSELDDKATLAQNTEAAKTASRYISHIDSSGIRIHPSGTTADAALINSEGLTVYKGDSPVASFGSKINLGSGNTVSGASSVAIGTNLKSTGYMSFAEGYESTASGDYSHAEGHTTKAGGHYSHAEGWKTKITQHYAHAEGQETSVAGYGAHAEGHSSKANGSYSHAEGEGTEATGYGSHAEGYYTTAGTGAYSHAEGQKTSATGANAHAEGKGTSASGANSHAGGNGTAAIGNEQTAIGRYNIGNDGTAPSGMGCAFLIGNGSSDSRSDCFRVHWNGQVDCKTVSQWSDERLKTDIKPIDGQDFFMSLKPVDFLWTELKPDGSPNYNYDEYRYFGLIAQEVEKSLESFDYDGYNVVTEYDGYKSINYQQLIPLCISMIQKQQQEIDYLKSSLEEKTNEVSDSE